MPPMPHDIAIAHPSVQARYLTLLRNGNSPQFAEMLALRQAPASKTDREFLAGRGMLADQIGCPHQLNDIVGAAQAHGYTPGANDVYDPGLARFMGDPEAFIPPQDARGHVKRVCEARGWAAHGMVEVKHRQPEKEPENCRLAPDLIEERMRHMIADNPDLARKDKAELAAEIVEKHGMPAKGIPVEARPQQIDPSKAVPMRKRRPKKLKL
jgi:hypothetical protein